MAEQKNWRYRFVVKFYDFWGLDVTKIISDERRFQRTADLVIISLIFAIAGTILPVILAIFNY